MIKDNYYTCVPAWLPQVKLLLQHRNTQLGAFMIYPSLEFLIKLITIIFFVVLFPSCCALDHVFNAAVKFKTNYAV